MSNMTLKKPKSLWFKTALIFLIGSIVICILFTVVYLRTVNIMNEKTNQLFANTVYQVSERCRQQTEQMENLILGITENQWIKNYLVQLEQEEAGYSMTQMRVVREALRQRNIHMSRNVYVYTAKHKPINCFYSEAAFVVPEEIQGYLKGRKPFDKRILWKIESTEPYRLKALAYIRDSTRIYGILEIQFGEDIFAEIFETKNKSSQESMMIGDEEGKIIYSPNNQAIGKRTESQNPESSGHEISYPIQSFGWHLQGVLDNSAVTMDLNKIIPLLVGAFLCVGMVVILIAVTIFRSFLRPVNQLLFGMEQVQRGELGFTMERKKQDEFGIIIDSFNFMIIRIRELLSAVQKQKNNYYRLEMLALKSKLNPHFLYNAFDMIYWKLILKNEYEIADVVVTLADILRYSVNHKKEFVSVREDMQYMSSYLSFQKMLLNDRLEYQINVPENLMECEMPKLLLQPLIENAIKYGLDEMHEIGRIWVEVWEEEEFILFLVKDNGKGMEPEKPQKLQGRKKQEGFGISLVRAMVSSTYGEECGIEVESGLKCGTRIVIKIKKKMT